MIGLFVLSVFACAAYISVSFLGVWPELKNGRTGINHKKEWRRLRRNRPRNKF